MVLQQDAKKRVLITLVACLVLAIGFYLVTNAITHFTGFSISGSVDKTDSFKTCLKNKDIRLFINSERSDDTLLKIKNLDFLTEVSIKNCFIDNKDCENKDISTFPTWIIGTNKIEGDITLKQLSEYSGCNIAE